MRQNFHIDFIKHSKIFFCASLGIMLVCLILNLFVMPTIVDIQFTGGTIIKYNYGGDLDHSKIEKTVNDTIKGIEALKKDKIDFSYSENLAANVTKTSTHLVTLQFTGNKAVSVEDKTAITTALEEAYPDNGFAEESSTAVDASKGTNFFLKCMIAVILAAVLMIFYVAIRFRKIGGLSAGVMAVVALIYGIDSIISFALPMMIGLISGSYSSLCIAAPLWVLWKNHKDKKKTAKKKNSAKAAKKEKKSASAD